MDHKALSSGKHNRQAYHYLCVLTEKGKKGKRKLLNKLRKSSWYQAFPTALADDGDTVVSCIRSTHIKLS